MPLIASHLSPAHIVLDAPCASKKHCLEALARVFEAQNQLPFTQGLDALLAREHMGSTALGEGVAIPHGRMKGLKTALCAVLRLAKPIEFDAPDGQPVDLLLALMVPQNATQSHLDLLGELAEMLSDETFRTQAHAAPDAASLMALFAAWQPAT